MEKIFLLSGLGADERLFKHIDLSGFDVVNVAYFDPAAGDSLTTYATKLISQYNITPNSNLIGVSLGGMLTVEIAHQIALKKAIIMSSIKSINEAPSYFAFFRSVPIYKLIPGQLMVSAGFLFKPFFFKQMGGESQLFNLMLKNSSPLFLKWAMHAVLNWKASAPQTKIHHFIGDADLVFNYRKISDATVIEGGDHMMVFTKGKELSALVRGVLAD